MTARQGDVVCSPDGLTDLLWRLRRNVLTPAEEALPFPCIDAVTDGPWPDHVVAAGRHVAQAISERLGTMNADPQP